MPPNPAVPAIMSGAMVKRAAAVPSLSRLSDSISLWMRAGSFDSLSRANTETGSVAESTMPIVIAAGHGRPTVVTSSKVVIRAAAKTPTVARKLTTGSCGLRSRQLKCIADSKMSGGRSHEKISSRES